MKIKSQLLTLLSLIIIFTNSSGQPVSKEKKLGLEEVEKLTPQIHEISQKLWDYSEIALRENKSSQLLINVLKNAGFSVEENVAGMPTAFVASFGSGSPVIGILAEYDALAGTGNANVPFKQAREDGITSGQGCGHNLFGSACVNAAIAIKQTMEKHDIKGTLKLFGTPAEETVVGKVYMAKAETFDGLDACLEWHPGLKTQVSYGKSLALNNFEVEFFGQAAHGAADPWNGRSALDAVELMNYGVNQMREHIYPTTRIHYVIPNGGDAPNVVPEYAKVWYYVRDTSRANVQMYYDRVLKIAEGAAIATRTDHKVTLITGVHEYNHNEPLLRALEKNLHIVGAPTFTDKEQEWARELQKNTGKEKIGFKTEITNMPDNWKDQLPKGGSTDVAEVSYITPTAGFRVATAPFSVPWHSWATNASHGTVAAYKGAVVATKVLTLTAIDLFMNEELRENAKEYFNQSTGGKTYVAPIPKEQKVMLPK